MAEEYVRVVWEMYQDNKTVTRCVVGVTKGFKMGCDYIKDWL